MEIVSKLFVALIIDMVSALAIMWLWNMLLPQIFSLPEVSFIQAFGIKVLCSLLFINSYKSE